MPFEWSDKPKKSWGSRDKQKRSGNRSNQGLGGGWNLCMVANIIRIYKWYRRF